MGLRDVVIAPPLAFDFWYDQCNDYIYDILNECDDHSNNKDVSKISLIQPSIHVQ